MADEDNQHSPQPQPQADTEQDLREAYELIAALTGVNNDQALDQGASQAATSEEENKSKSMMEIIREEVIERQNKLLQERAEEFRRGKEEFDSIDATKFTPEYFDAFLREEEGKKFARAMLEDKQITQEMRKIEIEGYKKALGQENSSMRTVAWEFGDREGTKTTTIQDKDGQEIATLSETTHKENITLNNGQTITSRRTIDFPIELESQNGPLDISMVLKDSEGRNMQKSNAVYLTAHYNDEGKLLEMSTPQPVKFSSDSPDAVAYIEHDNKIYTLPVTKEKYESMMSEVSQNQGKSVNLSSVAQEIAQDELGQLQQQMQGNGLSRVGTSEVTQEPVRSEAQNPHSGPSHVQQRQTTDPNYPGHHVTSQPGGQPEPFSQGYIPDHQGHTDLSANDLPNVPFDLGRDNTNSTTSSTTDNGRRDEYQNPPTSSSTDIGNGVFSYEGTTYSGRGAEFANASAPPPTVRGYTSEHQYLQQDQQGYPDTDHNQPGGNYPTRGQYDTVGTPLESQGHYVDLGLVSRYSKQSYPGFSSTDGLPPDPGPSDSPLPQPLAQDARGHNPTLAEKLQERRQGLNHVEPTNKKPPSSSMENSLRDSPTLERARSMKQSESTQNPSPGDSASEEEWKESELTQEQSAPAANTAKANAPAPTPGKPSNPHKGSSLGG